MLIFYTSIIKKRQYAINNYYHNKTKLSYASNVKRNLIYINIIFLYLASSLFFIIYKKKKSGGKNKNNRYNKYNKNKYRRNDYKIRYDY